MKNLQVYLSDKKLCRKDESSEILEQMQLVSLAKSKLFLASLFRYRTVTLCSGTFNSLPAPFLTVCACKLLSHGQCRWITSDNQNIKITWLQIIKMFGSFVKEHVQYKAAIDQISQDVDVLDREEKGELVYNIQNSPLFLRLDLTFGIVAGGSVGHIAGIVNNLNKVSGEPILVSPDPIPTIMPQIEQLILQEKIPFRNVNGISALVYNLADYPILEKLAKERKLSFIYQRSGLDIYTGAKLAINYKLPYVLEYNGSEIWCDIHWGNNTIRYMELAQKIEKLTFEKADLITCVSQPLKEQLIEQGIEAEKIIVNPNGVNPDKYNPDIIGDEIRKKYAISKDAIVVGFIGTFGAWHGAEILAKAFAESLKENKDIHLLMIGDGMGMNAVKKQLELVANNKYTLTGLIPQEQGAEYLAACDILVNPTIPNADGSAFFGSPTKLFEYMAMGKGIIASNMDQMAEVLTHMETAILVKPGDDRELTKAILKLVDNVILCEQLGKRARELVCKEYTWEIHTKKIIGALEDILNKRGMGFR